jgi:hypothetical protein
MGCKELVVVVGGAGGWGVGGNFKTNRIIRRQNVRNWRETLVKPTG